MKIKRYGKVVITEHDILVTQFDVEGVSEKKLGRIALLWAIKRIVQNLHIVEEESD